MLLTDRLVGMRIVLRSVVEDDAEFILTLRLNPELNKFIHATDASAEKQRQWIRRQQKRANDYYMIIEDLRGRGLGTIGVYNIDPLQRQFEWGRWLIVPGTPFHVAAESALLAYYFGFVQLDLEQAVFVIKTPNVNVFEYFHTSLRSEIIRKDEEETWFRFRKEAFYDLLRRFRGFHNLRYR